jgi:hypothetical protein
MSGRLTKCAKRRKLRRNFVLCAATLALAMGCSRDPPAPAVKTASITVRVPREGVVESPTTLVTSTPLRATLTAVRGAQLYVPPWFRPKRGGYDLIVHFHGMGKIQEANIERAQLNAAVVSINLGAGTRPYAKPFRNKEIFGNLLERRRQRSRRVGAHRTRRCAGSRSRPGARATSLSRR